MRRGELWDRWYVNRQYHYSDVIMSGIGSLITGVSIVSSVFGSGADQRKHQSSASLAFVRGIHREFTGHRNSPHKTLITRKIFPFDDVIMPMRDHQHMNIAIHMPMHSNGSDRSSMGLELINRAFMDEIWGVLFHFGENWPRYNSKYSSAKYWCPPTPTIFSFIYPATPQRTRDAIITSL